MDPTPIIMFALGVLALLGLVTMGVGVVVAWRWLRTRPTRRGRFTVLMLGALPGLVLVLLAAAWPLREYVVPHPDPDLEVPVAAACLASHGLGQPAAVDVFEGLSWNQLPGNPLAPARLGVRATDVQGRSATCHEVVGWGGQGRWQGDYGWVVTVTG